MNQTQAKISLHLFTRAYVYKKRKRIQKHTYTFQHGLSVLWLAVSYTHFHQNFVTIHTYSSKKFTLTHKSLHTQKLLVPQMTQVGSERCLR